MKKKDIQELRAKEIGKLNELAQEKKLELIKVKAELWAHKEKNLKRARILRKDFAQLLTIIGEKEIIGEGGKKG